MKRISLLCILLTSVPLALEGCGGRQVVPTKPAEMVIPPDLAKAFEVKEMPEAEAEKPPVEDTKSGKKKKTKKVKAKVGADGMGMSAPGSQDFVIPNRRPQVDPLWVGEKVWMDVTWLNTKAGEFQMEVLPHKVINGRKVYDIKGTAKTSDLFSLIYKAEDSVETFVDYQGWFPYKFVLHGDETKHIRNHLELYDHAAKKQYVHVHDNRIQTNEIHEQKDIKDLTPLSQDALSALYYVRTQKLADGAVIKFPMTTSGNQWETVVTVLGREEVSTKMGYIRAFKTKVETRFHGVLQQQGDAFMWFSDDERKFLVRFEAKVRIGWVAGIAKKIENGKKEDSPSQEQPKNGGSTTNFQPVAAPAVSGPTGEGKGKRRLWFQQLLKATEK